MGLRNMTAVFAMYPELPPLPKVLLLWMARKSLDPPGGKDGRPPLLYFDGEASLIEAGGRSRAQTYAALKTLRKAGAVEVVEAGRLRHQAVYKVALDPLTGRFLVSEEPDPRVSGKPDTTSPENRTQLGPENRTPRSTKGGAEGDGEEPISPPAVVSPALDAPVDNPEFDALTTEQANRVLIDRHGLERALRLLDQHGASHPHCENPAGHVLAGPTFTVIPGGKTA